LKSFRGVRLNGATCAGFERDLPMNVALPRPHVLAHESEQPPSQNAAQPMQPFDLTVAAELIEVPAGQQKSLLYQVRWIRSALQVAVDLRTSERPEVRSIAFEKGAQTVGTPCPGVGQQACGIRR